MTQPVPPPKFNVGQVPLAASPSCWVATQLKGAKAERKKLDQKELRKTESVHIQAVLKRELEKTKYCQKTNVIAPVSSPGSARLDVQLDDDEEPIVTEVDSRKRNKRSPSKQKWGPKKSRPHTGTALRNLEYLPSREKSTESESKTVDQDTSPQEEEKAESSRKNTLISYILIGIEAAMAVVILTLVLVAEASVNIPAFFTERYYKPPVRYITYIEMALLFISVTVGVIGIFRQSKAMVYTSMAGHIVTAVLDITASCYVYSKDPHEDSDIPDIYRFIYLGISFVLVGLIILLTVLSVRGVRKKRTTTG